MDSRTEFHEKGLNPFTDMDDISSGRVDVQSRAEAYT